MLLFRIYECNQYLSKRNRKIYTGIQIRYIIRPFIRACSSLREKQLYGTCFDIFIRAYPMIEQKITLFISPQGRNLRHTLRCFPRCVSRPRQFGIGSPCRRSTAKRSAHLARAIDPEEEAEKEESRVLSTFAAGVSRCSSRLDEFTHEEAVSTRPSGFLESFAARPCSICTSFASDRVAPSFSARAAVRTHVQHARVRRIPRRRSVEKSPSSNEPSVVDNSLRWIYAAYTYVSSILMKLMRVGTPSKNVVATYIWATAILGYRMKRDRLKLLGRV